MTHLCEGARLLSEVFGLLTNLYGSKDRSRLVGTTPAYRACSMRVTRSFLAFEGDQGEAEMVCQGQAVFYILGKRHISRGCCREHCCSLANVSFPSTLTVAFLFNWIGFFLSFCLTTSAAGRYGAISGFGLSLIKWILIVRVSCIAENLDCVKRQ